MKTLRVIACGDGIVPYVDEAGRFHANRAIGRGPDGAPAAEVVSDTHYVRRAMGRKHLVEASEPPPAVAVDAAEVPATTPVAAPPVIQRGIAASPHVNRKET